ncbi:MAG TPA: thioesterase family protein [Solirubrobacterales bacterium]|jgi:acyl-CoA thioester hydrolase|nr:thioesterase family protein [Solirubrobacterales bacterium]
MAERFRYRQRVRYHECDPQGVVFNGHYLAYFDVGMTELWREVGGYEEMIAAGTDMVVAEAQVSYRAPLRFDDEFDVAIAVTRLGESSMTSSLALERDGETVTEGELRHVFVTAGEGDKVSIPDGVRSGLSQFLGEPAVSTAGEAHEPRPA